MADADSYLIVTRRPVFVLWRFTFGPVVGGLLGGLQCLLGFEARRHRAVGAGENLVMLDVQGAQPALLAHGDGDEVADLDQSPARVKCLCKRAHSASPAGKSQVIASA